VTGQFSNREHTYLSSPSFLNAWGGVTLSC